jgi:hypothetical protein
MSSDGQTPPSVGRARNATLTLPLGNPLHEPPGNSHEELLTADQLVRIAIEVNPQVRATREQWNAAQHQILQNYVPADPVYTFTNVETSAHSSFQEKRSSRRIKQSGPPRLRV